MAATGERKRWPAEVMTPEEVAAIIGACSARSRTGIRNRSLITLLYRSGLRISEAVGDQARGKPPLRLSDVNRAEHSIRVRSGKGDRTTTRGFHPSADDSLARWIDVRRGLGIRNAPLFCTLDGKPVYAQYVRLMLGRAAAHAGVERRIHPHAFRHTYAVELDRQGLPVTVISKLLGHSSVAVTARYLDHLTNGQAVAALQTVDLPELKVT